MASLSIDKLIELQRDPSHIRHVCILAHVDHGKTTLADAVLASNGIIPQRMIGKLRYMDSRKDEQERGITMKSSAVTIHYKHEGQSYLINLIDSPGHADFSGEVSTAVRLCDAAVILIDVVEGVCSQTKVALRQAWMEQLHPLLVLNKVDRLILEWKLTPLDAYAHLIQVLEQVNAVVGELFAADIMRKGDAAAVEKSVSEKSISEKSEVFDWSSGLDESDDSSVYFSPEQGNVVFASALDGWGFSISHFAKIYSTKLGFSEDVLRKTLWSDFYLNTKTKRILKGAQAKAKKPLFVQFILENIWAVYESIMVKQDKPLIEKIVQTLDLKISARDSKQSNPRNYLQAVLGQWLPLSKAVLEMCLQVPSPMGLTEQRIEGLMCSSTHKFDHLPQETKQLKKDFQVCSSADDVPVIVYVSKMFPIERDRLLQSRRRNVAVKLPGKSLTADEIATRREKVKQLQAERLIKVTEVPKEEDVEGSICADKSCELATDGMNERPAVNQDTVFIAFARVYSGTVRKGQKVYVLGPKHNPAEALKQAPPIDADLTIKDLLPEQHITVATLGDVYLLMGESVEALDEVPAGNVLGIGGLEEHVLKSATLSNTVACPRFIDLHSTTTPIMRVALEPSHSRDMPALVQGMKLLNQADPCVQVLIQETGEHVLITAGEVHLQRCVNDLKERFAKIELNVSAPIVPFRETIIPPPKVDMVNEAIDEKHPSHQGSQKVAGDEKDPLGRVHMKTANKLSSLVIRAVPLPSSVTRLLEQNSSLLKEQDQAVRSLCSGESESNLSEELTNALDKLKNDLNDLFTSEGSEWCGAVDQIWAFGPKRCGPNILLNRIPGHKRPSVWITSPKECSTSNQLFNYDSSFISGFQLATFAGPLCDEPMMGVCFIVEDWLIEKDVTQEQDSVQSETDHLTNADAASECSSEISSASSMPYGPFTGQIMSTVKEACRKAFQSQPQRLMTAVYSCNIQVTAEVLGKMYAVLGRRHGRVLHADLQEGSQTFFVSAELPVVESFDFTNEIRKQTSGMALPQLVFSHWEVVELDPFWVPSTDEEYAHFGEKADSENRARKYMNAVRRRKGLPIEEKIVEHAEKQRTLNKKK